MKLLPIVLRTSITGILVSSLIVSLLLGLLTFGFKEIDFVDYLHFTFLLILPFSLAYHAFCVFVLGLPTLFALEKIDHRNYTNIAILGAVYGSVIVLIVSFYMELEYMELSLQNAGEFLNRNGLITGIMFLGGIPGAIAGMICNWIFSKSLKRYSAQTQNLN